MPTNSLNEFGNLIFLNKFCNVFALVPFYNFNKNELPKKNVYKIYALVISIVFITCYFGRITITGAEFSKMATTTVVLFTLSQFSLIVSVVLPIISSAFCYYNDWKSFFQLFSCK